MDFSRRGCFISCLSYDCQAVGLKAHEQDAKNIGEALGKVPAFLDSAKTVKLPSTHYKFVSISDCSKNQIVSLVRS